MSNFLRRTTTALQAKWIGSRRRPSRPASARPASTRPASGSAVVIAGTRVEYTPAMDGDPDPGEIVWAWVAYEDDPSQGKDRPVVVIGRRERSKGTLVGIPLTSRRDDRDPQVPVGTGPWDRERRPSYAQLDRVLDLDARAVRREGAVLARDRFDDLIDALRRYSERD